MDGKNNIFRTLEAGTTVFPNGDSKKRNEMMVNGNDFAQRYGRIPQTYTNIPQKENNHYVSDEERRALSLGTKAGKSSVAVVESAAAVAAPISIVTSKQLKQESGSKLNGFGSNKTATATLKKSEKKDETKGLPWTAEEHAKFLQGLSDLGRGKWRAVSKHYVPTRTPTQIASHAQKYFQRMHSNGKRKSRFTVIDELAVHRSVSLQSLISQGVADDHEVPTDHNNSDEAKEHDEYDKYDEGVPDGEFIQVQANVKNMNIESERNVRARTDSTTYMNQINNPLANFQNQLLQANLWSMMPFLQSFTNLPAQAFLPAYYRYQQSPSLSEVPQMFNTMTYPNILKPRAQCANRFQSPQDITNEVTEARVPTGFDNCGSRSRPASGPACMGSSPGSAFQRQQK